MGILPSCSEQVWAVYLLITRKNSLKKKLQRQSWKGPINPIAPYINQYQSYLSHICCLFFPDPQRSLGAVSVANLGRRCLTSASHSALALRRSAAPLDPGLGSPLWSLWTIHPTQNEKMIENDVSIFSICFNHQTGYVTSEFSITQLAGYVTMMSPAGWMTTGAPNCS